MALLVQVFHCFEGDAASADDGDVIAAVEFGTLVLLVAAAEQGDVGARADLAAHRLDVGDFVTLGFALAPVPSTSSA